MRNFISVILRGIGQVFFQKNALSGLLMLVGIAVSDWRAALLALAGNIIGNLTAAVCRYAPKEIEEGLYGFNGTLVGIAIGVFFRSGWEGAALLVAGSALSTWITHIFLQTRKPGYTAPFILATWVLLGAVALLAPTLRPEAVTETVAASPRWLQAFTLHFGQVMFQGGSVITGLCFMAGIAVNDRLALLYALWGAVLPLAVAFLSPDFGEYNTGLYGYNAVLCAIALAGHTRCDFLWATVAVLLSVALQWLGMAAGAITLTAPFVLAVWAVLLLKRLCRKIGIMRSL